MPSGFNTFGGFGGFSGFGDNPLLSAAAFAPLPTARAVGVSAPALQPAPAPEDAEATLLGNVGGGLLSLLEYGAGVLDKPARILRGGLTGLAEGASSGDFSRLRELGNLVPFSDSIGLTNPQQMASGRDLLTAAGLTAPNDPNAWEGADFAGFGAEVLLDPLNLVTGPLGALTKAGKAAKAVGPEVARAARIAAESPDAFRAFAQGAEPLAQTAKQALADAGDDAAAASRAFADTLPKTLEPTVAGRIREGQGGLVEVWNPLGKTPEGEAWSVWNPLGESGIGPASKVFGTTEKAAAGWEKYVGNRIDDFLNVPTMAAARAMLDPSAAGAKTPELQNLNATVTKPTEDVLLGEYRGKLYDLIHNAKTGEYTPDQLRAHGRLARQAGEDLGDFSIVPTREAWIARHGDLFGENAGAAYDRAFTTGRSVAAHSREFLKTAQDLGIPVNELADEYIGYVPRLAEAPSPRSWLDFAKQIVSTKPSSQLAAGRKEIFKNFPAGTTAINDLATDPRFYGEAALDEASAAETIFTEFLRGDRLANADRVDAARRQAADLASYLRNRPAAEAGKPLFIEDPTMGFAARLRDMARARSAGEAIQELVKRHAVHDPDGRLGVSVPDFLKSVGGTDWTSRMESPPVGVASDPLTAAATGAVELSQQGATSRAASTLAAKFGIPDGVDASKYSIPHSVADEAARLVKLWSAPDDIAPLLKAYDSYNNLSKSHLTQPWPAFGGRNILDGLSRMYLSTGAGAPEIGSAVWRAAEMARGADDPLGKLDAASLLRTTAKAGVMFDDGIQAGQEGIKSLDHRLPRSVTADPNLPDPSPIQGRPEPPTPPTGSDPLPPPTDAGPAPAPTVSPATPKTPAASSAPGLPSSATTDPLLEQATALVRQRNKVSQGSLQSSLGISGDRALKLLDELESTGVIGPQIKGQKRAVLPFDPASVPQRAPAPPKPARPKALPMTPEERRAWLEPFVATARDAIAKLPSPDKNLLRAIVQSPDPLAPFAAMPPRDALEAARRLESTGAIRASIQPTDLGRQADEFLANFGSRSNVDLEALSKLTAEQRRAVAERLAAEDVAGVPMAKRGMEKLNEHRAARGEAATRELAEKIAGMSGGDPSDKGVAAVLKRLSGKASWSVERDPVWIADVYERAMWELLRKRGQQHLDELPKVVDELPDSKVRELLKRGGATPEDIELHISELREQRKIVSDALRDNTDEDEVRKSLALIAGPDEVEDRIARLRVQRAATLTKGGNRVAPRATWQDAASRGYDMRLSRQYAERHRSAKATAKRPQDFTLPDDVTLFDASPTDVLAGVKLVAPVVKSGSISKLMAMRKAAQAATTTPPEQSLDPLTEAAQAASQPASLEAPSFAPAPNVDPGVDASWDALVSRSEAPVETPANPLLDAIGGDPPSSADLLGVDQPPRPRQPLQGDSYWDIARRHYLYDERQPYGGWMGSTRAETLDKINPLAVAGWSDRTKDEFLPVKWGRRGNQVVDDVTRLAHAILLKERGWDDSAIASELTKWHFDYGDSTPFERNYMKRLIPFWMFSARNAPLVAGELLGHPGKYATPLRATTIGSRNDENSPYTPDYIGETLGIPLGPSGDGNQKYLTALGLGSMEEPFSRVVFNEGGTPNFGRTIERHLLATTPLVRMAYEQATGRQLLTGRDIDDVRANPLVDAAVSDPATASVASRVISNTPASRYLGTLGKLVDDRSTILEKILNLTTGARVVNVDSEAARRRDLEERVASQLDAAPHLRSSERYYAPSAMDEFLTPEERQLLEIQKVIQARRAKEAKARKAAEAS